MTVAERRKMERIVGRFADIKVVVLGDIMLDKYIWGSVSRISPEAPVPVVEVKRDSLCLGGAGNVCRNLETLGAAPVLVGIVGSDPEGRWIRRNVPDNRGVIMDRGRPTTVKTRIIAGHQQVVRVDLEKKKAVSEAIRRKISEIVLGEKCRGIVLSDYDKGVLTPGLLGPLLAEAEARGIMVFVDPKVANFGMFSPVTLVTPNHAEAERIVHHECRTDAQVEKAGREILARVRSRFLILKRGEQGLSVFEGGKPAVHIPTVAREVFDVTGAGDTVIAVASLALLAGATIFEAASLANAAAGVVVGKIGTATAGPGEILAALDRI